ncbi:TolC family protein [Acidithiobacillus thiooxidans]|uniref:TolC family protein n=1 Tax=Acidithiobacillus thiooxidans TaxID=930 RepID=UPI000983823A|nr:TolC family protein [Acidithiobacillus thiooxidans]
MVLPQKNCPRGVSIKNQCRLRGKFIILIAATCCVSLGWVPIAQATVLTLRNAIQRAEANQSIVQQAKHIVSERMDLRRAAHANLLPGISLVAGSIWSATRNGSPLFIASNAPREIIGQVQINIPLYSPQVNALQALARNQIDVARYQEDESRLLVAARVTTAYYRLALLHNECKVWRSALVSIQSLYKATKKGYQIGSYSRLDLAQTQLMLTHIRGGLRQVRVRITTARRILALQIGDSVDELPNLAVLAVPDVILPKEQAFDRQASQAQPLLLAAKAEVQVARSQLQFHRAARLPVVQGVGAYGIDTGTLPQTNDLGWQVGLTLHMPIFGFGRNRDRIAAAQEHLAAVESGKLALLLHIQSSIATDYGATQAALNALHNDQVVEQQAHLVYQMTRKGYLAGALSALDLQQAEKGWVQARLKLAGAAIGVRLAKARLALDTGVLPQTSEGQS